MLFSALRAAIFQQGLVVPGAKLTIRRAASVESSDQDPSAEPSCPDRGLVVQHRPGAAEILLQAECAGVFGLARPDASQGHDQPPAGSDQPESVENQPLWQDDEIWHLDSWAAAWFRDLSVKVSHWPETVEIAAPVRNAELLAHALNARAWEDEAEPAPSAASIESVFRTRPVPDVPLWPPDPPPDPVTDSPRGRSGIDILAAPNLPKATVPCGHARA